MTQLEAFQIARAYVRNGADIIVPEEVFFPLTRSTEMWPGVYAANNRQRMTCVELDALLAAAAAVLTAQVLEVIEK